MGEERRPYDSKDALFLSCCNSAYSGVRVVDILAKCGGVV